MEDNNDQLNLRDVVHHYRSIVDGLNSNSLVAVLRKQNNTFAKALDLIEKYLPAAENLLDQDIPDVSIKTATIFLIGLWSKVRQGGSAAELTKDDMNSALGAAFDQAVAIDPKDYTLFVFDLYKKSIAFAIPPMGLNASPSAINRLKEIVALMEESAEALESGAMPEAKFIEENLWLSLEAVFLVLTDRMNFLRISEERRELAEAVEALVFQKIRFRVYDREVAAVNECLEYQAKLDQELTEQVNAYIDALRDELDEFDALVDKAFDPTDFRVAFAGSAELAEFLGAEEILKTQRDVDDYFMF